MPVFSGLRKNKMIFCKKQILDNFDYMLLSLVGYNLVYNLAPIVMSKALYNGLELFFFIIFFVAFIKEKKSFVGLDTDIKIVLKMFIFWNAFVVLYSLLTEFNLRLIMLYVVQPTSFLIYVTPCFMLLKYDQHQIKKIVNWLFINIIIGLISYFFLRNHIAVTSESEINIQGSLSLYTYLNIAEFPSSCFMASSFVFIYGNYDNKWKHRLLWVSLIIAVIAALLLGRRSSALIPISVLLAKVIFDFYHKPKMLLWIVVILFMIYNGYNYLEGKFLSTFIIFQERAFDNTRFWVEHDFFRDMNGLDYLFGRGSEGLVYSSELGRRPIIETGYLNMILHGGVIYLLLYLYLLIISAIRGFSSRNSLIVAMSFFILIMIACLYPGGHLTFSINTFVLWLCVACCSSKRIRNNKNKLYL